MGHYKQLFLILFAFLIHFFIHGQTSFGPQQIINDNANQPLVATPVDFDNDGNLDLLTTSRIDKIIGWYKNDGNGEFGDLKTISSVESEPWHVYPADLNGDGNIDIISADVAGHKVSWYKNLGNNNFGNRQVISNQIFGAIYVYAADLDDDNDLDILYAAAAGDKLGWFENLGNENFGPQKIISSIITGPISITAGDFDGDNDLDALSASITENRISWHENDGTGLFTTEHFVSNLASDVRVALPVDIDNDGDIDIVSASEGDNKIALYENEGAGTFKDQQIIADNAFGASNVTVADLDNDGDLDILASARFADKIVWYENLGSNNFSHENVISNLVDGASNINALDYDNDGDLDIVSASLYDKKIAKYENLLNVNHLSGNVLLDDNENCIANANESGLNGFIVSAENILNTFYSVSNNEGYYKINSNAVGPHILNVSTPGNYWESCIEDEVVNLIDAAVTLDLSIQAKEDCSEMVVSVSNLLLRRCYENSYTVHYCNVGTVDETEARIDITLDPFMEFVSAEIPHVLTDSTIQFNIGDVPSLFCNSFKFIIELKCDAELGQNHCVEASIYPQEFCGAPPANWDMSNIEVNAKCDGDSVEFRIQNNGIGNMLNPKSYFVAEENVIFRISNFQLDAGEEIVFKILAKAVTYYISAEQSDGNPNPSSPITFIEGCNDEFVPSTLAAFPLGDEELFYDIDCQKNIGSFDPNDKLVDLVGYGPEHFIEANIPLEYKIRFQNTGTDTAFYVQIVDTLSSFLDEFSIVLGASSHPYDFNISEDRVIRFTFEDIELPDSNVNSEGSNGFVTFKINQKENNEIGTVIENNAGIYFDFNTPVITNTVFHTIGENFVKVVITNIPSVIDELGVDVYPNPSSGNFAINFKEPIQNQNTSLRIFDTLGKEVWHSADLFGKERIQIDLSSISNGIYIIEIESQNKIQFLDKILIVN